MLKRFRGDSIAACCLSVLLSAQACAAPDVIVTSDDSWQFDLAINLWSLTLDGTTRYPISGGDDMTTNTGSLYDKLKMAFLGSFEVHKGDWSGFTDISYVLLGDSKQNVRNIELGGTQIPAGVNSDIRFDLKGAVWELAGAYRVVNTQPMNMEVFAGMRLLAITMTVSGDLSGNVGTIPLANQHFSSEVNPTIVDGIVGAKGRIHLSADNTWFLPYYFDIGTGQSDYTLEAMGGLGYAFKWGDVTATYRYLDYHLKSADNVETLSVFGPVIAVVFHF
jgi:hypothetical protein